MPGQGQVERIAGWSWSAMPESRWRWYAWFTLFVAPIPLAGVLERHCIDSMVHQVGEMRETLFPVLYNALSWIGLSYYRGDVACSLWNNGCAAAQAFPYVLLVVVGRLIWLRGLGKVDLHPLTASRTLGVLGLVAATRLPPFVIGWGIMAGLNALLPSHEELAITLMTWFNDFLPWFSYGLNKIPAALIAQVALHVAVQSDDMRRACR